MNTAPPTRPKLGNADSRRRLLTAAAVAAAILTVAPAYPVPQQQAAGEIAANLAAGRAVFCVAKDAMLVASVPGGTETGSRAPSIVPLGSDRFAVLLGAIEWNQPDSGKTVRLDAELPVVARNAARRPTDSSQVAANRPTEIEALGIGVLELIRPLTGQLHRKLDLAPNEPLVEVLVADYVENYGPEIWSVRYRIQQEDLGNDFWNTRILRPAYYQLYPPEKGQRRTFVEVRYPDAPSQPTLLTALDQNDGQLARVRSASPEIVQALGLVLKGTSDKAAPGPLADFLRSALPIQAGGQAKLVLGELDAARDFRWLLPPEQAPPPPGQTKPLEPGAPSLRKYNPPQER